MNPCGAMTDDDIIDAILFHEGGFSNLAEDRGSATNFGITAVTLGAHRHLGRAATTEEVRTMTQEEARTIYRQRYITDPGFTAIADGTLRHVVVDDAVMSGPTTAIRHLQLALNVPSDGRWGPVTAAAVAACDAKAALVGMVKARCLHYAQIVRSDRSQAKFIVGWISRALSFL